LLCAFSNHPPPKVDGRPAAEDIDCVRFVVGGQGRTLVISEINGPADLSVPHVKRISKFPNNPTTKFCYVGWPAFGGHHCPI